MTRAVDSTSVLDRAARAFLARHRIARLATADAGGTPHVVPFCYAMSGGRMYFVVDDKPKFPGGRALKRMRNIAENPAVAFVVDDYAEDWSALAYLLVRGRADLVEDRRERARAVTALRARYPQYRAMNLDGSEHPVVRITPSHAHLWQAARGAARGQAEREQAERGESARVTRRVAGAQSRPRGAAAGRRKPRPPRSRSPRR